MFERNDWLMIGAAFLALMGLMGWNYLGKHSRPQVFGAGAENGPPWYLWPLVFLLLLVFLSAGLYFGSRYVKKNQAAAAQAEIDQAVAVGPTVALLPRSDARPVQVDKINLWDRLADALPHDEHIAFEIGGNEDGISFTLHGSDLGIRAALTQVRAEWPGVQQRPIEAATDPAQLPDGWVMWWCECVPATWDKPVTPLSDEPLRAIFFELKGVMGQGRGLLQVIARNDFGTRKALGESAFAARASKPDNAGVRAIRTREAKEFEDRAKRTFLQATIRAVGMADTPERAQGIARGLGRAVAASFGHSNPVRVVAEGQENPAVAARQMGLARAWGGQELAYLGHLTGQDMLFVAPRLQVASARSLPADPAMRVVQFDDVAQFMEKETPGDRLPGV